MRRATAILLAFVSGFAVMVLEIVGARLLAKDFGSSFYVWTSQIGVVLVALTLGYVVGGVWADRFHRLRVLFWALLPAAVFTALIPQVAASVIDMIVSRHPLDQEIPRFWQKVDPAIGSALIFLPPCFVLAALPPFLIRLESRTVAQVGRISGSVYGAGSAGSIAGVFLSGYVLIEHLSLAQTFGLTAALMVVLAILCRLSDARFHDADENAADPP
jgi:MFS family permease